MKTRTLVLSTVGAQAARAIFTLGTGPLMSRLIGPAPYGILAPALTVALLGKLVADSGFAVHTVTAPDLSKDAARDLHRQSLRSTLAVAVPSAAIAASIGDVTPVQRLLRGAIAFALVAAMGATAVPGAWVQRMRAIGKMEWRAFGAQVFATLLVAIPLALLGYFVAAATANAVVPAIVTAVIAWRLAGLGAARAEPAEVDAKFRREALALNVTSYLAANADILILSTYLAESPLGVYSRGLMLAAVPGGVVGSTLAKIGLSEMSRSPDTATGRRFLVKSTGLLVAAYLPLVVPSLLGVDLTAWVLGEDFAIGSQAFLFLCLHQIMWFAASLQDNFHRARRDQSAVVISCGVLAFFYLVALCLMRPLTVLPVSLLLLSGSGLRFVWMAGKTLMTSRRSEGGVGRG